MIGFPTTGADATGADRAVAIAAAVHPAAP